MNRRAGFTLVELLLFSAIFAVVIGGFVSMLVAVTRIQVKSVASVEVNSQSTFLLENIQRLVERASLIEAVADTPSSTIKLRMASSSEDPTLIYASGTTIYVQQSSSAAFPLTSSDVQVSDLKFVKRANPPAVDAVAVSFTVTYNSANSLQAAMQALNISVARVSAATFDSNLVPSTNNAYKIGTAAQDWQSINNTLFFGGSGYVGVGSGAATPGSLLDLDGALTFRSMSAPSTSTAGQAKIYYDSSANALKISQNAGAFSNLWGGWSTSGTAAYYSAGNVGIGTSSPSTTLHIWGSTSTLMIGDATRTSCVIMGDTDGAGVTYVTALNGVLSATTTKPLVCL